MKKIIAFLSLIFVLCFSLALVGCGEKEIKVKSIKINILKSVYFIDEFTYNDYTITATYTNAKEETVPLKEEYIDKNDIDKVKSVGTHSITISYGGKSATFSVTIKNHEIEGVTFENKLYKYDGTEKEINVENLPSGATVSYNIPNKQINAGEYVITATVKKQYHNDKQLTARLIIEKATYDMSAVKFDAKTLKYDGQSHSIFISGQLPKGVSVEYINNEHKEKGAYIVTARFTGDYVNYNKIPDKTATLTITREEHTVTFRQANQPDITQKVLDMGSVTNIPNPVAVPGYTVFWEEKDLTCVTSDIVVNAVIVSESDYTITYELNGGSATGLVYSYNETSPSITLPTPTKKGYTFTGWSGTGIEGTQKTVTIPTGSSGDRTYTANYTTIQYEIQYNLNGGNASGTLVYYYDITSSDITLPQATKTGHTFSGWSGTGIDGVSKTVTIPTGSTGNRQYTANFASEIQYTVILELVAPTYNNGMKKTVDVVCKYNKQSSYTVKVNENDSLLLSKAVPVSSDEYSFVRWEYVDKNGVRQTFVNKGETGATIFNSDTFDSTTIKIYAVCTNNYSGVY